MLALGPGVSPFRSSHFSAEARRAWASVGYDVGLISEGLDAQQAAILHPNLAWGLHMAGGDFYRSAVLFDG